MAVRSPDRQDFNRVLRHSDAASMQRCLSRIDPSATGYSASSPDLPGCIATGASAEAVEANMREAIEFHLDGPRSDGHPVPPPHMIAADMEVAA